MKRKLNKIIKHFGKINQIAKAKEELQELRREIVLDMEMVTRKEFPYNVSAIIDKIADVEIMLQQLRIIFSLSENEIKKRKKYKIARTLRRIKENYYK